MVRFPAMPAPAVTLRKDLARTIRAGHPWIFRDAIQRTPQFANGTVVEVDASDGRRLATGFWDATSAIAVRVLEVGSLEDVDATIRGRFEAALKRRLDRLDRARTNAFRWVHGEADRLPGIHVDLYDEVAVVRFDGEGARTFYRGRVEARDVIDRESGSAPSFVVRENGFAFEVAPGAGGKGGLYLDQRENRELVERRSRGRSVLNLFGYTGGFAMYAARGGASLTDTVDVSKPAIVAAKRNFKRNALPPGRFHIADAFEFLEAAVARGTTWDVVISDPPSFAPRKSALEKAMRAYTRLHRLAASVTSRGGLLCAASCSSHVGRADFIAGLKAGARGAGRRFELGEVRGAGFDHPVAPWFPEGDYLKFAIGKVV